MLLQYSYTQQTFDPTVPQALDGAANRSNQVFMFNIADCKFQVEPRANSNTFEGPAGVLRNGAVIASSLAIPSQVGALYGPHEDHRLCRDSTELTYTTRVAQGGGVIEKIMAAGAQIGDRGRMNLYKSCTIATLDQFTERITREFIIVAADLTSIASSWPNTGAVPTVDATLKQIVDGGGDGYNHV
jgi:hypothetical protein